MNSRMKKFLLFFAMLLALAHSNAASGSDTIPAYGNPLCNLSKENLRILDIGNSYTLDATHYIPQIAAAANAAGCHSLYCATRGGASFRSWVDAYNDKDTEEYEIGHICGYAIPDVTCGDGRVRDGHLFRQALKNGKWDLILIHQYSSYSANFDAWNGGGNKGCLKELISIIRETNPQAAIGFLLIHSWSWSYAENKSKSSFKRWQDIANSVKRLKLNYGIDFIVPYGTAVENLRATSLNDGSDFSTDGSHLADGLGDYVAACCYWETLFAPRFGSIVGNGFRLRTLNENQKGVFNITDETALVAQKAAVLATKNMYQVTDVDSFDVYMQLPAEYAVCKNNIIGYNYNEPAGEMVIPEGIIGISDGVFNGCKEITGLHLSSTLRTLGSYAFYDCSNIETIISLIPGERLFAVDTTVFGNVDKENCKLHIPAGALDAYKLTEGWNLFENIIELSEEEMRNMENTLVCDEDRSVTDLAGRAVKFPTKGVYIINGKKILIK